MRYEAAFLIVKSGCPFCEQALALLVACGIAHHAVDTATIRDARHAPSMVPAIFLKRSGRPYEYIGGFTELQAALQTRVPALRAASLARRMAGVSRRR